MPRSDGAYPVVDLFAGPGGLGEGFAHLHSEEGSPMFNTVISIEKEEFAHRTLLLRHFFRCFPRNGVPGEYYDY
ncbi:MAG: DNA cytosine methyltransferase, partial [Alphaproteobacteria bacterium]|nr:DNA cytosine methyltransferase [Alphaproteobacteria bacterium]